MVIPAYAKINLRLEVEKKLDNGYHVLHMINSKIDLKDEISIEESNKNEVLFDIEELNHMSNNIVLNILNELTEKTDKRFKIYIKKNIPQGAGLGGGSSDAAAVIHYIDKQLHLNKTIEEKMKLGLKYGSDIPYCLIDDVAYVEGIGEIITPLTEKLLDTFYLIYPNIHLSTKDVFCNNLKYSKKTDIHVLNEYVRSHNYQKLLYNDLEDSAFYLSPELKQLKEELLPFGNVGMSGSGSTLLLLNPSIKLDDLKKKYPNYMIVKTKMI